MTDVGASGLRAIIEPEHRRAREILHLDPAFA
jgi:hypothetical protein